MPAKSGYVNRYKYPEISLLLRASRLAGEFKVKKITSKERLESPSRGSGGPS